MQSEPPFAHLRREVTFTLREIADILAAVDVAVEASEPGSPTHVAARHAQRLITTKLWPELGDILDPGDADDE